MLKDEAAENTKLNGKSFEHHYYCRNCRTYFKKEDCEFHQSKIQRYPVCPSCPTKYKLRVTAHNKKWKDYVQRSRLEIIPILSKMRRKK